MTSDLAKLMEYIDMLQSEEVPAPKEEVITEDVHPLVKAMRELMAEGIVESVENIGRPTVNELVISNIKGEDPMYWTGGGRCYEFADNLYTDMEEHGYKGMKILDAGDLDWDEHDNHAWVEYQGKHYDALNPEGVNDPSELDFYANRNIDETVSTGLGGGSAGNNGGPMVGGPTTYEQEYNMFKTKGPRRIMPMT